MHEPQDQLRELAARINYTQQGRRARIDYMLAAFKTAPAWAAAGETERMIFASTYVTDPLAFRVDVDVFTAALRLGVAGTGSSFSITAASKASKYAWARRWSPRRLEFEVLCWGTIAVAKQWNGLTRVGDEAGLPVAIDPTMYSEVAGG